MTFVRKNFARARLAVDINAAATQITVAAGHTLPIVVGSFRLVVWDSERIPDPAEASNLEIVTGSYVSPNVYNIIRAQEDTIAVAHSIGDRVALHYTAGVSQDDVDALVTHEVTYTHGDIALNTTHRGLVAGNPHVVTPTELSLVIGTNVLAQQIIGIADDNLVEMDDADNANSGEYAKFTANGLEGKTTAQVLSDIGGQASGNYITALTGEVTASGPGSVAATITANAVTYAKMQDVSATDKILGRVTAGAGDVEEIACTAAGRAILDDADASAQRTTIGLGSVENTALSTWAGTTNITTLGTITTVGNITFTAGATTTLGHAAGALLSFDDTNNYLTITGCKVGIGDDPDFLLDLQQSSTSGTGGQYPSIRIMNTSTDITGGNLSAADCQWITLNGEAGTVVFQLLAISTAAASYSRIGTLTDHDVQFFTNSTVKAILSKDGNFAIGGTPGTVRLYVEEDSNSGLIANFRNTGDATPYGINIDFSAASPDDQTRYFVQGEDSTAAEFNIWSDGTFAQVSDRKVKKNIVDTSSKLDEIMKLRVVDFNRKNDETLINHTGLIAQEVEEIFPHLISYSNKGKENERLMLDRIGLTPLAIKAIQELKIEKDVEIEQLKVEIAALKAMAE